MADFRASFYDHTKWMRREVWPDHFVVVFVLDFILYTKPAFDEWEKTLDIGDLQSVHEANLRAWLSEAIDVGRLRSASIGHGEKPEIDQELIHFSDHAGNAIPVNCVAEPPDTRYVYRVEVLEWLEGLGYAGIKNFQGLYHAAELLSLSTCPNVAEPRTTQAKGNRYEEDIILFARQILEKSTDKFRHPTGKRLGKVNYSRLANYMVKQKGCPKAEGQDHPSLRKIQDTLPAYIL